MPFSNPVANQIRRFLRRASLPDYMGKRCMSFPIHSSKRPYAPPQATLASPYLTLIIWGVNVSFQYVFQNTNLQDLKSSRACQLIQVSHTFLLPNYGYLSSVALIILSVAHIRQGVVNGLILREPGTDGPLLLKGERAKGCFC